MSDSNKVLLTMFVVGVTLVISSTLITFSDRIKDPTNNALVMILLMIIGVVLLIISARLGLKKIFGFLS
ncbi:MAG: hypothetical protein K8Q89_01040 [Nitrosarchaeum sp.]|nr:hypothetical protein [Nitrosarchaeum sp.]